MTALTDQQIALTLARIRDAGEPVLGHRHGALWYEPDHKPLTARPMTRPLHCDKAETAWLIDGQPMPSLTEAAAEVMDVLRPGVTPMLVDWFAAPNEGLLPDDVAPIAHSAEHEDWRMAVLMAAARAKGVVE